MTIPSRNELASAIELSAFQAISDLFAHHQEDFYYCALFMTEDGLPPFLAAWSREALSRELAKRPQADPLCIKWNWAESPYLDYGSACFSPVKQLYARLPRIIDMDTDEDAVSELLRRADAMEQAMRNLDQRGLFGRGESRNRILINAEIIPPDYAGTESAMRLNPPAALTEWLAENCEPKPEGGR